MRGVLLATSVSVCFSFLFNLFVLARMALLVSRVGFFVLVLRPKISLRKNKYIRRLYSFVFLKKMFCLVCLARKKKVSVLGMGCGRHGSASEWNFRPSGASVGAFRGRFLAVPSHDPKNLGVYPPLTISIFLNALCCL